MLQTQTDFGLRNDLNLHAILEGILQSEMTLLEESKLRYPFKTSYNGTKIVSSLSIVSAC